MLKKKQILNHLRRYCIYNEFHVVRGINELIEFMGNNGLSKTNLHVYSSSFFTFNFLYCHDHTFFWSVLLSFLHNIKDIDTSVKIKDDGRFFFYIFKQIFLLYIYSGNL